MGLSSRSHSRRKNRSLASQLYHGIFKNNPKLWESLFYLGFVAAFSFVSIGAQGGDASFLMAKEIRALYDGFNQIRVIDDW